VRETPPRFTRQSLFGLGQDGAQASGLVSLDSGSTTRSCGARGGFGAGRLDLGKRETGFQFIRQARETGYGGRIFIVTAGMTDAEYVTALGLGICGIFLKHSIPELLVEAIHKVVAGQTWSDERCIKGLSNAVAGRDSEVRRNELTERERQVLKGVFTGLGNKEIAAQLGISEASVKSALQQLFVKTGVRTRSQLVRVVLEEYGGSWSLKP